MESNSVKLNALDLVITVLKEHEKNMDRIVKELTFLVQSLEKTNKRNEKESESTQHEKLLRRHAIRIDEDLLKKARELGLNVSKVFENALKETIAQEY